MKAIEIKNLTKKFDHLVAVDNVSLSIDYGEIFALLGPNGAGKTTIMNILSTLLEPTSGNARVNGYDVVEEASKVRESIGIVFQDPSLDDRLTARENLDIHGRLYHMGKEERAKRIDEVLEMVELKERKNDAVRTFSGGMKRRLEIARGLMHRPKVIFLDEPTLGLDPQTRRHIWDYIKKLREEGMTVMLTTHYMEEADELADRVAIIDKGKIVALGTPSSLKDSLGGDVIRIRCDRCKEMADILQKNGFNARIIDEEVILNVEGAEKVIPKIFSISKNIEIYSVMYKEPSLEDVFIKYTGKAYREESPDGMANIRIRLRR